jgi:hypothetical protein
MMDLRKVEPSFSSVKRLDKQRSMRKFRFKTSNQDGEQRLRYVRRATHSKDPPPSHKYACVIKILPVLI